MDRHGSGNERSSNNVGYCLLFLSTGKSRESHFINNNVVPKEDLTLDATWQTTGQAFVSTYQTTFYKTNGYAAEAFTYPVINSCLGFLSVLPGMYLVDKFG